MQLEGVNFSSVDTKVRLTDVATFTIIRDVDAQVCGDDETKLTEIINGVEVPIIDCRVHDRLTFRVPDDVPPGLYDFQVMVPNVAQVPGWGPVLFSNAERDCGGSSLDRPVSDRHRAADCPEETAPESFGSDEVGIRILGVPLFPDLTSGEVQQPNGGKPIRFSDRRQRRIADDGTSALRAPATDCGAILSIMGFEIDGEEAFEKQIDGFSDALRRNPEGRARIPERPSEGSHGDRRRN